jgi:hypothetical protein
MSRKVISITLTFLIIVIMIIPLYAADIPTWISCSVSEGNRVNIEWGGTQTIARLLISRDNGTATSVFKNFTINVPSSGNFSFVETGVGAYTYKVVAYDAGDNTLVSKENISVVGTGKPSISLEYINHYNTLKLTDYTLNEHSVERIHNWVKIYNTGSADLDLRKLKVRYFFTVDGEPHKVNETIPPNPNNGQRKEESSDGRINPTKEFFEYPVGNREKQIKESVRMEFTKMETPVTNSGGLIVADYYCDTFFENPGVFQNLGTLEHPDNDGKLSSASNCLTLQPAFNKMNLTDYESNAGAGLIKYYDLTNDYSYNNNNNIAVYYDNELIWGNDPSIIAPKDLTADVVNVKDIELNWTACKGATSYTIFRCKHKDGIFSEIAKDITDTSYLDSIAENPTEYSGEQYDYKAIANYDKIKSGDSNIAQATIYPANTDLGQLNYNIIYKKSQTDFIIGSYIPIVFELKLSNKTKDPTIILTKDAKIDITGDTKSLIADLATNRNTSGVMLLKATLTKVTEPTIPIILQVINEADSSTLLQSVSTHDGDSSDNRDKIVFNGEYARGDIIRVEFVTKLSVNPTVLSSDIKNYNDKSYNLNFSIQAKKFINGTFKDVNIITDNLGKVILLPVKIVKPDKLK